jgi:4-amino-4-deoxy-L-arabinose transferase-like glycosyltransferase
VADDAGSARSQGALFLLFFAAVFTLHIPLISLPYFWDEAGYYIPAARDLLLTGTLIPHSTVSNAHPPLVTAYLAAAWRITGFTPAVTRCAMLLAAAFALVGVFRLAQRVANTDVAIASTACTALYPVFFAQSSLAHLDLAAAGFTFWGFLAYVDRRRWGIAAWFSLAVLTKETAVLAPLALFVWELARKQFHQKKRSQSRLQSSYRGPSSFWLLFPILPLGAWYAYHWHRTGFLFGNPEFFRYNVQSTLHPLRIILALAMRFWHVLGYMGLYVLTSSALLAMLLPALSDAAEERKRIAVEEQLSFLSVVAAYVLAMALIGGAVLARYMLPAIPLVIIICVSTLRRRVRYWYAVIGMVAAVFVVGWFVNPPYGFSMEDNLAYRDYILLHEHAERSLEARHSDSRVLTAWPASDELTRPYLGYVTHAMQVFRIEDFSAEQLMAADDVRSQFDVALVFSTKYEPPRPWFERWRWWQKSKAQYFGYHRDVPPPAAAQILGGQLVYSERRQGQWVGIIEIEKVQEARTR